MFDLKGRTVVITGASSGLGKAAVYAYAKAGAAVLITARRFERLESGKNWQHRITESKQWHVMFVRKSRCVRR